MTSLTYTGHIVSILMSESSFTTLLIFLSRPVVRHGSTPVRSPSRESVVPVGGTLTRRSLQPVRPPKPDSKAAVIRWFREAEMPRGVLKNRQGVVNKWFHGILSRVEAEDLLSDKKPGTFLVRVSEKIWGYTISVKVKDRSVVWFYYNSINQLCSSDFPVEPGILVPCGKHFVGTVQ